MDTSCFTVLSKVGESINLPCALSSFNFCWNCGSSSISLIADSHFCTTASGIPTAKEKPLQKCVVTPLTPCSAKVGTSGNNVLREDFLRHESLSWLSLLIPDLSKAKGAPDRLGSSLELEQRFEDFLTGAMPMGLHHALCRIDAGCPHRRHDRSVFLD